MGNGECWNVGEERTYQGDSEQADGWKRGKKRDEGKGRRAREEGEEGNGRRRIVIREYEILGSANLQKYGNKERGCCIAGNKNFKDFVWFIWTDIHWLQFLVLIAEVVLRRMPWKKTILFFLCTYICWTICALDIKLTYSKNISNWVWDVQHESLTEFELNLSFKHRYGYKHWFN